MFIQAQTHVFSFFIGDSRNGLLSEKKLEPFLVIQNQALYHRIVTVLRLVPGTRVFLFDGKRFAKVMLRAMDKRKKSITFDVVYVKQAHMVTPRICLYVGITQKKAFEKVCQVVGSLGINYIIPVVCKKVHKAWIDSSVLDRLQSIVIAGCEQAKNFMIPIIKKPCHLPELDIPCKGSFVLQKESPPLYSQILTVQQIQEISIFIGPEGGFTQDEVELLVKRGCTPACLGPTTLTTQDAVTVSGGLIRSMYSEFSR